jgi:hypothetical protein
MLEQKIRAQFIFEMLGKPAEHLNETLKELIDKMDEQKGIQIVSNVIHEPKPFEEEGSQVEGLFTTFADVELELDNTELLIAVTLNMLPAHVEVIEPSELRFSNFDLSKILSELTIKMHKYDEVAKALTIQRGQLMNKIGEMQETIDNFNKEKKDEKKVDDN